MDKLKEYFNSITKKSSTLVEHLSNDQKLIDDKSQFSSKAINKLHNPYSVLLPSKGAVNDLRKFETLFTSRLEEINQSEDGEKTNEESMLIQALNWLKSTESNL